MRLDVGTPVAYGGTEALYMKHERAVLRSLVGLADAGVIERASALQQIGLLHAAKSMLGATILADDDPWRSAPTTEMTAPGLSSAA